MRSSRSFSRGRRYGRTYTSIRYVQSDGLDDIFGYHEIELTIAAAIAFRGGRRRKQHEIGTDWNNVSRAITRVMPNIYKEEEEDGKCV